MANHSQTDSHTDTHSSDAFKNIHLRNALPALEQRTQVNQLPSTKINTSFENRHLSRM